MGMARRRETESATRTSYRYVHGGNKLEKGEDVWDMGPYS